MHTAPRFALSLVAALGIAGPATAVNADLITEKYNFGESADTRGSNPDSNRSSMLADWTPADQDYDSVDGFGWTFIDDDRFRDRGGSADLTLTSTNVVDTRNFQSSNPGIEPFYTFQVDLENGIYDVTATLGDANSITVTYIALGDAKDVNGALDETDASTVPFLNDPIRREIGEHNSYTTRFEVTNGLLLFGFRPGEDETSYFSAVNGIEINEIPEPGSLALLGLGTLCLIRRRR